MSYIPGSNVDGGLPDRFIFGAQSVPQDEYGGNERRKEPRFLTNDFASVRSLFSWTGEPTVVSVVDVSRKGLGLCMGEYIQPGTAVQVKVRDLFVLGEVRYCRQVGNSFSAGILVDSVLGLPKTINIKSSEWRKSRQKPS